MYGFTKDIRIWLLLAVGIAAAAYIRRQRTDFEIARFDYMMRVMKENGRSET